MISSAAPTDRLAAFVADLILLVPFISLMTSPFRRQYDVALLLGDESGRLVAMSSIVFGAVFAATIYQTAFLALWGATPGKRLLGLKVVTLWSGRKPSGLQSFLRSFVWCMEFWLLLVPWLAALLNERRRPWHDRIADTDVVPVDPQRAVGPPTVTEIAMASSVRAAVVFAFCGFFSVTLLKSSDPKARERAAFANNPYFCTQVTEASEDWLGTEATPPSRLDVALALFGADAIAERCLEVEAEYALWNGMISPSAYMAKALARADEADVYIQYARKACEKGAKEPACQLGRLLSGSDSGSAAPAAAGSLGPIEVDEVIKGFSTSTPLYLRVYAMRELVAASRFEEALRVSEFGSPHRKLGYFFASHRAQALWGLHRQSEARLAVQSANEGLSSAQRTALARWLCSAENATVGSFADGRMSPATDRGMSCAVAAAQSCGLLRRAVERDPTELEDANTVVAWIRGEECMASGRPDVAKMRRLLPESEGQLLLSGLESSLSGDVVEARKRYRRLVEETEDDSPFWFEAQARLVTVAENEADLEAIQKRWQDSESGEPGWLR
ncbi:MAG: RDD family protein, partial [Bdellovibrionaceae bacterium]|nr:RDD family protein [Pseudobdellovibrionaceae bacterium]